MSEVWLHSNRRVLLLAIVPVAILHGIGIAIYSGVIQALPVSLGAVCIAITAALFIGLLWEFRKPRIAYREGLILFYLKAGAPLAVPLDVVEAFFQGESLAHLPGENRHHAKSVNLIARLSQRESDWQQRNVKAALGRWEDGYITVRGTWCEPIDGDVIRRLNRRLSEVKRDHETQNENGD